jgi:hypothetical protein
MSEKKSTEKKESETPRTLITIDPDELMENACLLKKSASGEDWAVCVDEGKIKLFPVAKPSKKKKED